MNSFKNKMAMKVGAAGKSEKSAKTVNASTPSKKVPLPKAPMAGELQPSAMQAPKIKAPLAAPAKGVKIKNLQDLRNLAKARGVGK